jgi:hypothetical protein
MLTGGVTQLVLRRLCVAARASVHDRDPYEGHSSTWKPTTGIPPPHLTREGRRCVSFFTYASYRAPDAVATISRVLAIPAKRPNRTLVLFLTSSEAEAPHRSPGHQHLDRAP